MKTIFDARLLKREDYSSFEAIYNDFKDKAMEEYKFELPPVD